MAVCSALLPSLRVRRRRKFTLSEIEGRQSHFNSKLNTQNSKLKTIIVIASIAKQSRFEHLVFGISNLFRPSSVEVLLRRMEISCFEFRIYLCPSSVVCPLSSIIRHLSSACPERSRRVLCYLNGQSYGQ